MVQIIAQGPFVTILDGGDMIAAVKGDKVTLPKARADELIKAGVALLVSDAAPVAPENKRVESPPENKDEASPVVRKTARRRPPHSA